MIAQKKNGAKCRSTGPSLERLGEGARSGDVSGPRTDYPARDPRYGLLNGLAVHRDVEALDLGRFADANYDRELQHHEDDEGGDAAPLNGCEDAVHLDRHLSEVALEETSLAAESLHREHARQDGADDTADGMNAEDVEAVVIAQHLLQ